MTRKITKLFWCGVFIVVFSAYLVITNIFSTVAMYTIYSSLAAHQSPPIPNYASGFTVILLRDLAFLVVAIVLLLVGVYVLKQGIRQEPDFPAPPAPAP